MRRIQDFLLCDEVDPKMLSCEFSSTQACSINDKANFHWGFEKPKKDQDDKKAKKGAKKDDEFKKLADNEANPSPSSTTEN